MDTTERIKKANEIIEASYKSKLIEAISKETGCLYISFNDISSHSPELADDLLDSPSETLKAIELAIQQFDTLGDVKKIIARIKDLPKSVELGIGDVRYKHIDKLYRLEGTIIRVGDTMAMVSKITFECPSCGNVINVLQLDSDEIRMPSQCGCGRKGKFRELSRDYKNVKHIIVEEYITDYSDKKARPSTIKIVLENDLAEESLVKKLQPSKHVIFNAIIKDKEIKKNSTYFKYQAMCNSIEVQEVSLFNLKVPQKYIDEFKKLKGDKDIVDKLSGSIFYMIHGSLMLKRILTISRARGIKIFDSEGKLYQRDTINPFIISNPGRAKSVIAKAWAKTDIVSMVVSGKGGSGVGITAATSYDKELGCWVVEPGVVPRCHSVVLDEIDKMDDTVTSSLNEAMTNLSFMIAKGNQQAVLPADCNICGLSNPIGRRWDRMTEKCNQIPLKPDFLDRFDIWVAMEENVDTEYQKKVARKIIDSFREEGLNDKSRWDIKWIRYYYAWIIQNFKPTISDEVADYATEKISMLMNRAKNSSDEGGKAEISNRIIANVIRFAIALSKIEQSNSVLKEDIDYSIELQMHGFRSLEMVDDQGKINEERIAFQEPQQKLHKRYTLIDLMITKYQEKKELLTTKEIKKFWEEEGNESKEVDDMLTKLSRVGKVIEVRYGFWRPVDV